MVNSISAQAIRLGAQLAVDEINAAGGVLGGRTLALVEKDDRSVPARFTCFAFRCGTPGPCRS